MQAAQFGKRAEKLVCAYLLRMNHKILSKRFRIRGAELDIVSQQNSTLYVIEVKARRGKTDCHEFTFSQKSKYLRRGLEAFLLKNPVFFTAVRFDLVLVEVRGQSRARMRIFPNFYLPEQPSIVNEAYYG